jgi:hypothetical protein
LTPFLRNSFDQERESARRRPRGGFAGSLEKRRRRDGVEGVFEVEQGMKRFILPVRHKNPAKAPQSCLN